MSNEYCIMPDNPPIWRNKRVYGTVRHEVFFGVKNRQKSIEDGLVIFLTPDLHNMDKKKAIHFNIKFDKETKMFAESVWLMYYNKTIDDFIKRYGRNYIMNYFEYYKETWVPIIKQHLKNAETYEIKKEIKTRFYKNIQLNERQKDVLWKQITFEADVC